MVIMNPTISETRDAKQKKKHCNLLSLKCKVYNNNIGIDVFLDLEHSQFI